MTPSQAFKQKIEAMGLAYQMGAKPSTRKYSSLHYIQEDYCSGAQSLVPLVESLVGHLEKCETNSQKSVGVLQYQCTCDLEVGHACRECFVEQTLKNITYLSRDALTNYRKFIGEKE